MPQGPTQAVLTVGDQHRWGRETAEANTTERERQLDLNSVQGNGLLANRVSVSIRNSHIGLLFPWRREWCQARIKCSLNLKEA